MPKNFSAFQLVLLVVFGILAIAGVLIFALAVGGSGDNSVGRVEVWGTLNERAFNTVIASVAESDPRLEQVVYVQKDPATYESDLTNALSVGGGPDLFILRNDYSVRNFGKILPYDASLTSAQFKSAFVDASNSYLSGIGVLGLPIVVDPLVLYWNKDMLGASSFATPPGYWDEVLSMAEAITKKNDSGGIVKSAIALGEYSNINNAKDILSAIILQSGGTITGSDISGRIVPAIVSRGGIADQASETALRFYTQFADPSNRYYSWSRGLKDSRSAFAAGDLALYIGFGSEASLINSMNPNLNFDAAPLPQVRDSGMSITTARVYALAISRMGKNPKGANVAAQILAGSPIADNISIALGMSPASRAAIGSDTPPKDKFLSRQALIARTWVDPDPEKTADIFRAMIERVSSGSLRLSEAVERADQELSDFLAI